MPDDFTTIGAPDGTQIRFPSSMKDADIEHAMSKLYPGPLQTGAGMEHPVDPITAKGGATNPIENARLPREGPGAYNNAQVVGHGNVPEGRAKINKSGEKVSRDIAIAAPILGGVAAPMIAGATIPGALRIATMGGLGAAGGRYAGGGLGGMFGPTGKQIGEGVGSVLGGLAGGLEGYKMQPPNPEEELGSFMNKGYKSMDIPPEEAERGAFMNRGYQSMDEPPARMPGLKIGHPEVNVVPEPRGEFAGENPNYMASVPRDELNRLAVAAKPGAGTQLQQLGKPIIYIPRGSSGSW